MNWLNYTCNDESQKLKILDRHRKTTKEYKSLVNYYKNENDILVDIKHFMILLDKGQVFWSFIKKFQSLKKAQIL